MTRACLVVVLATALGCQDRSRDSPARPKPGHSNNTLNPAGRVQADQAASAAEEELAVIPDANGRVKVSNARCPVMPEHAIRNRYPFADNVVAYKRQFIGFCCTECVEAWKTMSEADRDAALVKSDIAP